MELAISKFPGGFKWDHLTHNLPRVFNDLLLEKELGRRAMFITWGRCARTFETVSYLALLEPLSYFPFHILVRNLTAN